MALMLLSGLAACTNLPAPPQQVEVTEVETADYLISPLDQLQIYVWRSEDLSVDVPVRPDGRISVPLVGEIEAAGKTISQLTTDISDALRPYVQQPVVSVIVAGFGVGAGQSIKIVGEVSQPASLPYSTGLTLLDVMVQVGGLTEFAAGNDAVLIRNKGGEEQVYGLRLESLLKRGDMQANAPVLPGDVILIPQSFF